MISIVWPFFFKRKMSIFTSRNQFLRIMYRINVLLAFLFVTISVAQESEGVISTETKVEVQNNAFGKKIDADNSISEAQMLDKYAILSPSDTLAIKFSAKVVEVCQAKGCWMRVALKNGEEAMVKFKDYGFFVPKDIAGQEVIINGNAFVNEMSVEEQQHYAKDGGKSKEEINQITDPKKTYGFEADGVLLKL